MQTGVRQTKGKSRSKVRIEVENTPCSRGRTTDEVWVRRKHVRMEGESTLAEGMLNFPRARSEGGGGLGGGRQ